MRRVRARQGRCVAAVAEAAHDVLVTGLSTGGTAVSSPLIAQVDLFYANEATTARRPTIRIAIGELGGG